KPMRAGWARVQSFERETETQVRQPPDPREVHWTNRKTRCVSCSGIGPKRHRPTGSVCGSSRNKCICQSALIGIDRYPCPGSVPLKALVEQRRLPQRRVTAIRVGTK